MPTVTFPCSQCQKLMAVNQEHLGQQVRCPHCQQVILAAEPSPPAPLPPLPPLVPPPDPTPGEGIHFSQDSLQETQFTAPPAIDREDIFSAPEPSDEDILNSGPRSRVEMPVEPGPVPPPPSPEVPTLSLPPIEAPVWPGESPSLAPTLSSPFGAAGVTEMAVQAAPPDGPAALPAAWASEPATPEAPADSLLPEQELPRPQPRVPRRRDSGAGMMLLVITLFSWALTTSLLTGILFYRIKNAPAPKSPLEMMPDEGENPPASRKKIVYQGGEQTKALPESLQVRLGDTLRIGDLEVMPEKAEWRTLVYCYANMKPEPSRDKALVLDLRLKNISKDVYFYPMDSYFDRQWKKKEGQTTSNMPFTYLQIGDQRFFGARKPWQPLTTGRKANPREYLEGQNYDQQLKPGEEMTTFVATDPNDPIQEALANYSGELLWRIQLRRGLVLVGTKERSATAVIGVRFTDEEIR